MKLDGQKILEDLKAQVLPQVEQMLIAATDVILKSVAAQATAQAATDSVAAGVALVEPMIQPEIDALMAKFLAPAAPVA